MKNEDAEVPLDYERAMGGKNSEESYLALGNEIELAQTCTLVPLSPREKTVANKCLFANKNDELGV